MIATAICAVIYAIAGASFSQAAGCAVADRPINRAPADGGVALESISLVAGSDSQKQEPD